MEAFWAVGRASTLIIREMPRKIPRLLWVVLPLAYLVYFYDLSAAGLLGPVVIREEYRR